MYNSKNINNIKMKFDIMQIHIITQKNNKIENNFIFQKFRD